MKAQTLVPVDYVELEKHVRKLERLNPQRARAVVNIAAYYVQDEHKQAKADRERGQKRSLESRLLKVHRCETDRHAGFAQLPPSGDLKSWRCEGCGQVITLPAPNGSFPAVPHAGTRRRGNHADYRDA
jgi:hypothetical protein